jgi:hypothetical protein
VKKTQKQKQIAAELGGLVLILLSNGLQSRQNLFALFLHVTVQLRRAGNVQQSGDDDKVVIVEREVQSVGHRIVEVVDSLQDGKSMVDASQFT